MLGPHKRHIVVFSKKDLSSPVVNLRLLELMKQKYGIRYAMLANMQHQWRPKERNELFALVRRSIRDTKEKLDQEEDRRLAKLAEKENNLSAQRDELDNEQSSEPLTAEEKLAIKKEKERLNAEINRQRENSQRQVRGPTRTSISLIIGLPNVGKSTLINQIIGRRRAGVASQPGWTKGQQLYRVDGFSLDEKRDVGPKSLITPALRKLTQQSSWLLDTPGVMLPHRIETEQVYFHSIHLQRATFLMHSFVSGSQAGHMRTCCRPCSARFIHYDERVSFPSVDP
jgi:ribosome biogenesis GTPase A